MAQDGDFSVINNGSTFIDTDKLLDDPYEYQSDEVRAECDIIHTKEMLAYYEEMENSNKNQKTYQQPGNSLEETESKSEDRIRKRDSSDRTSNTRQTGNIETVKMKLEWLIALTITIIGLIVMMRLAANPSPQQRLWPTNNQI